MTADIVLALIYAILGILWAGAFSWLVESAESGDIDGVVSSAVFTNIVLIVFVLVVISS